MLGRCRVVCSVSGWWGEGGGRAVFLSVVSLFWVLASRLARLNCRRFLAGQFFLSGVVSRWVFVSRVPRDSTGLGSKIVCSIDEKLA